MWRSVKRIWAVTLLTSTDGLRQPAFFMLFLASTALIALSPNFAFFHLGEESKMVVDLGLSTILTAASLLAVLTASTTVTDEIEGRTTLTMLSKPLRRGEFLAGKYFGVVITSCALVTLLAIVLIATLRSQKFDALQDPWFTFGITLSLLAGFMVFGIMLVKWLITGCGLGLVPAFWLAYMGASAFLLIFLSVKSPPGAAWEWRVLLGPVFIGLHTAVIAAMAIALAAHFTLIQAAIGTLAFFICGHTSGALIALFENAQHSMSVSGNVLRTLLPDLDQFNITDALATAYLDKPVDIPLDVVAGSALYALLYVTALLTFSTVLFSKREL